MLNWDVDQDSGRRSVKTLTGISSEEAAVVVKMFVAGDLFSDNALSTLNSPNTSLRHDRDNCQTLQ